jgi:hypothetical protein
MGAKLPPYYSEEKVAILKELGKAIEKKDLEMIKACYDKLMAYESNN